MSGIIKSFMIGGQVFNDRKGLALKAIIHWFRTRWGIFLVGAVVLGGCARATETPVPPTATFTLPAPQVFTTSTPSAEAAARAFFDAWNADDTAAMYAMLTNGARSAISEEEFAKRYQNVADEAALLGVRTEITSQQVGPQMADLGYRATLNSAIVGELTRDMSMRLLLEGGQWRVDWNDSMIMPELAGGNYLALDRQASQRAAIYDRNGVPLAKQTEAVALGLWPDYVDLNESKGLMAILSGLTNIRSDTMMNWIRDAGPGEYIPLGEAPVEQNPRWVELLANWGPAVVASTYNRRLYYGNGIGPHILGYVSAIQEDELAQYRRKGYRPDERVGRKGLEAWGEELLGGVRGGSLYVFSPDGRPVAELGVKEGKPGQDVYTTYDGEFQRQVQKTLSVYNGAVVVLERDTGRVLAMASSPGFDPNAFEFDNANWSTQLAALTENPNSPQFNRATQGQYPLGSVSKLVTIAAALESGRFNAESTLDCQYEWNELPGFTRYDWTWDHFQEDGETRPSGLLTLPQGLVRSCNPWFWHIGLDLFNNGRSTDIAKMARSFGLGSKTGLEGLEEEAGNITDPATAVDAINQAIGQGDMLVTPLQVARFVAALGNGGTLYKPQVIEQIMGLDGTPVITFTPQAQGTLPIKPENLAIIQAAMRDVVVGNSPRGTAWKPLNGLNILVAGKTGTATAPAGEPHAWFAGYTFAGRSDKPDIAVAVIAENAGEGSEIAAPIWRRVVELYFFGSPQRIYPWEAAVDVTKSPTPIESPTPTNNAPGTGINP